jgi:endonuclease/exonuclease/phosphatase (EEP) superfamily protein YafD
MKEMKVIYMNARSVRNKFSELLSLIASEQVDILVITESWLETEN